MRWAACLYETPTVPKDFELVEAAVEQDGLLIGSRYSFGDENEKFSVIPREFQNDPRIRLAAVKSNGFAADPRVHGRIILTEEDRDDADIMRVACKAPRKLDNSVWTFLRQPQRDIVALMAEEFLPLTLASDRLLADADFVLEMLLLV